MFSKRDVNTRMVYNEAIPNHVDQLLYDMTQSNHHK
jgi:hypothetical protein